MSETSRTMRPLKALLPVDQAYRLLWDATRPIERTEQVEILAAVRRVLAEGVVADQDVPPFPRSPVDGYAVRAEDTFGAGTYAPVRLRLIEVVHAGDVAQKAIAAGTCIQVGTGAPLPAGADAVVMVEDTDREDETILVHKPVYPKENTSARGADIACGTEVAPAGLALNPSHIGVLAALGRAAVRVYAKPRLAVIPSGNEITPLGEPLRPGAIYDINSYTLAALIGEHGGEAVLYPAVKDDEASIHDTLTKGLADCDMVILSGGSSAGERDVMVDVIRAMGTVAFHGIAVKPGKPTLGAVIDDRVVLGMPGNPTSCLTNAYHLLIPVLRKMARLPAHRPQTVRGPLARKMTSPMGKVQFLTVRVEGETLVPAFKESGTITSMANADGYVVIPENVDLVDKGEVLEVVLF